MSTKPASVEDELRELLDQTRREAEMYSSAHYRRSTQEGKSGLGMRLEAIEDALIMLAHAIDERTPA